MKRIDKLTEAQAARLAEYRDKWLRIGLATGPCDRLAVEAAADLAYREAGLPPPRLKLWLQSPFAGCVGAAILASEKWDQVRDQVRAQVRAQVGAQVGDQVWAQVRAQVGAQVGAQVRAQVGAQVGAQVRDQVRDQVRAQVRAQVGAQVGDQVGDQVRAQVYRCGYGQHDANWLAFYDYFMEVCSLEICGRLRGLNLLAQSGWWWPFQGAVILTERPSELHRDSQGRLHNTGGAAIKYPDEWGVYAVHGIRVPAWVVERKHEITPAKIDAEQNAEIRRVMLEFFGQARYLRETNANQVSKDRFGVLWRKEMSDDEPLVMLELLNSTPEPDGNILRDEALQRFDRKTPICHDGMMMELAQVPAGLRFKTYMLRVPPNMRTAKEASAWSFDVAENSYELAQQS